MDREIPKAERNRARNKRLAKYAAFGIGCVIIISILISALRSGVQYKDLVLSTVDQGTIEVSVSASGKVAPAFEEIINSPISTRIVEVYRRGGDSVDVGTPILKLDLQSTETEYNKLLDEEEQRRYRLNQLRINNRTQLSDMAMQIKVNEMQLNRMKVELRNEQYLDSLGAGTTDKVRQAELSVNVAELELEQLRQRYANEQEVKDADMKMQELDFNIFLKTLAEKKRTLDDAQIRSPRKAILTFVNNQVGAQISQGEQVAIISDLSHFKVEAEIADAYGERVAAGGRAIVKIGSTQLAGVVSSVTPLSRNGVISFSVQLDDDSNTRLRSGLRVDVYVMSAVKEDVMRIANASYYMGKGEYDLFVMNGEDELVKRKVQLGDSNFEFVEVVSGLRPGDRLVVSDMSDYRNKEKLKVKR
ncbi:MAG: HlyD family efflux transporter periplasmic adaptor subunit [Prevotellaceae bacterium]|jgi:HlyD family secretion protein|nr:HlyD family efflux transporter periplasmic adaptor subunit [Prevotellaceae bacterium]